MEHEFTFQIRQVLTSLFDVDWEDIYSNSFLLQYLNIKTRSATRGAKARGSFANIYAVYVLVEDYLKNEFDKRSDYSDYAGARYTDLFRRQRELPFGNKLQNHALNSRMNEEFRKYFPNTELVPILRDLQTNRYWINENLLKVRTKVKTYNIALAIIQIIDSYIEAKRSAFEQFLETCETLKGISTEGRETVKTFIAGLLAPHVDARIFEIVSYAILKYFYHDQTVYFGFEVDAIREESLKLYKTGRTNANDGGIDFVMRPLGRFFQVTETVEATKYFLDIDKVERYPITFVIKSEENVDKLKQRLHAGAERRYAVKLIVKRYMDCIEEIINLQSLRQRLEVTTQQGYLDNILDEIVRQSRVEFNFDEAYEPD